MVIEQAKRVISERAGVGPTEAFARLRAYARNHNLRLTDVAQEPRTEPSTHSHGPAPSDSTSS